MVKNPFSYYCPFKVSLTRDFRLQVFFKNLILSIAGDIANCDKFFLVPDCSLIVGIIYNDTGDEKISD